MVHGLTAGRMVDQVHRLVSLARLTCTELTHGWPARGVFVWGVSSVRGWLLGLRALGQLAVR